jgi:hypothetical protein
VFAVDYLRIAMQPGKFKTQFPEFGGEISPHLIFNHFTKTPGEFAFGLLISRKLR